MDVRQKQRLSKTALLKPLLDYCRFLPTSSQSLCFFLLPMNTPLWMRRKFFDSYGERPNEKNAELPPNGIRFSCPCCGYPMLGERGGFEICRLCWWEDDGQDASDVDEVRGGPNHGYSLTEAQFNFEQYLVMYPPEKDTRIGGADSEKVRELKRDLIAAFDKMLNEPTAEELNSLWQKVDRIEKALYKDMKAGIREYATKMRAKEAEA